MPEISPGVFEITISEQEIGTYEARSCFATDDAHPKLLLAGNAGECDG